jgi:cytochrome c oxidase subunit 2
MVPAAFAQWLSGGPTASPAATGRTVFEQYGCVACHETGRAPNLAGVYGQPVHLQDGSTVVADDNYIRQSILSPSSQVVAGYQPIMPAFAGQLSEDQLIQLIAYIKSLGATKSPQASPPPSPVSQPSPVPLTPGSR